MRLTLSFLLTLAAAELCLAADYRSANFLVTAEYLFDKRAYTACDSASLGELKR